MNIYLHILMEQPEVLYSAPLDQFEANLYVFDYIVKDIQFA